jgi:hypothetical protein
MIRAFAWYVAVATIALGAAGLVVDLDRPEAAGDRPELTARGDRMVAAWVPRVRADARELPTQADALAAAATDAFAALGRNDPTLARERIASGAAALERIATTAETLRASRSESELTLGTARVSDEARRPLTAIDDAIAAADALQADWAAFAGAVVEAADAMEAAPNRAGAILERSSATLVERLIVVDRARGRIVAAVAALD